MAGHSAEGMTGAKVEPGLYLASPFTGLVSGCAIKVEVRRHLLRPPPRPIRPSVVRFESDPMSATADDHQNEPTAAARGRPRHVDRSKARTVCLLLTMRELKTARPGARLADWRRQIPPDPVIAHARH